MCVRRFLTSVNLISFLTVTLCDQQLSTKRNTNDTQVQLVRVPLIKTTYELQQSLLPELQTFSDQIDDVTSNSTDSRKRVRRQENDSVGDDNSVADSSGEDANSNESSFQKDEVGWSVINDQVDYVIPLVLQHLQKLNFDHLQLPDMEESISVNPLFITYQAGLFLTNGIVYNIDGIKRYGDAHMTYEGKSFLCRFNLLLSSLQFEYDFLIKLMAIEGYGRVIGSLDDTIIYSELAINVANISLKLNDFRITSFNHIRVQLDQSRLIRQLTGAILSPITNLFRDRITTSISDGLKEQMQLVMDDFNNEDPLQLRTFAKRLLSGLLGGGNHSNVSATD